MFLLLSLVVQRTYTTPHIFFMCRCSKEWSWRDRKKGEKAIQIIGRRRDQIAIPFHHVGSFAQFVEH